MNDLQLAELVMSFSWSGGAWKALSKERVELRGTWGHPWLSPPPRAHSFAELHLNLCHRDLRETQALGLCPAVTTSPWSHPYQFFSTVPQETPAREPCRSFFLHRQLDFIPLEKIDAGPHVSRARQCQSSTG